MIPWGLFAFYRFLSLEHIIKIEHILRNQYSLPSYEQQFNAKRTLRFILFEKLSRDYAKRMTDKIKSHQEKIAEKQKTLEENQPPLLSESDIMTFF